MKNKITVNSTFNDFYNAAPIEIQDYIDRCEYTKQCPVWHPEGDCKIHTRIVFNKAKFLGDLDLMIAAIFHDLGKVDTTKMHPKIEGRWTAHGHEIVSANLVLKHKNWIESVGGNFDKIYFIVLKHMVIKHIHDMRKPKQDALKSNVFFDDLVTFSKLDNMR